MQKMMLLLWLALMAGSAEKVFCQPLLQSGDRVVFIGDSITQQRIYTRYVMNYFALRYPEAKISFRNAGWNGDTASGGLARLRRDVLSLNPTVVSICYGMNDAYPSPSEFAAGKIQFDQNKFDTFIKAQKDMVAELKRAGVRIIFLTPGCIDADQNEGLTFYNATLEKFADGVKELAAKEDLPVYDIHVLMLDVQSRGKADNKDFKILGDSVHPANAGHAVMAYGLLKAMGVNDQPSGLWIDTARKEAITDRCTVKNLKVTKSSVRFSRTDDALPAYFDPDCAAVYEYLPIMEELNQYRFRVTGLVAGTWKLTVQGIEVGSFSSDALARGIDLATSPGPWQKLGEDVNRMSAEQENAYLVGWREVAPTLMPEEGQPEFDSRMKKLDKQIAEQEIARIQAVASNRTWNWSLVLAK